MAPASLYRRRGGPSADTGLERGSEFPVDHGTAPRRSAPLFHPSAPPCIAGCCEPNCQRAAQPSERTEITVRTQYSIAEQTCATCRCWSRQDKAKADGECRALPPTASGWPHTKDADWCVAGWVKDGRVLVPDTTNSSVPDLGQVGLNYAYVRDYPEDACTWLECVTEHPTSIPVAVWHVIASPLQGEVTEPLPAWEECDALIQWATNEPGGDNPAAADASGIFCYLDTPEERELNLAVLSAFEESHPWIVLCKRLAEKVSARA